MTADEATDALLDEQTREIRQQMVDALLGHGIDPAEIQAYALEFEAVLTKLRAKQRPAIFADVLLAQCLSRRPRRGK